MSNIPDPLMHFLGSMPGEDPALLLGVPRGTRDEGLVLAALRARLAAVAAHPDANQPEADLAREALHNAAQFLLSAASPAPNRPAPPSAPPSAPAAPTNTDDDQLLAEVRAILSAPGGLNAQSFARLTLLANTRGTTPQALIALATGPAQPAAATPPPERPAPRPAPARPAPSLAPQAPVAQEFPTPAPEEIDPAPRIIKLFIIGAVAVVAFIGAGAILLTWALKPSAPPPPGPAIEQPSTSNGDSRGPVIAEATPQPAPDKPSTKPDPQTPAKPTDAPKPTNADGRVREWADVARALDACVNNARSEPQAATDAFESAIAEMSTRWTEATPDSALASSNTVVDFLYAVAADPALVARAADAIVHASAAWPSDRFPAPDELRAALWSSAMAVRAGRERDLPAATQRRLQEAAGAALGGRLVPKDQTFADGLSAAIVIVPSLLVPTKPPGTQSQNMADAWSAWLGALESTFGRDTPAYDRAVSLAIESVLTHGVEPTQDRATYELVATLTAATTWRKDSPARLALLRWFQNDAITPGDLQAVTSALATRSGAEGVDPTMVLSVTAGPAARSELRDRYAAAWQLIGTGPGRHSEILAWTRVAKQQLETELPATTPERMLRAVIFARLNRAASELASGAISVLPEDIGTVDNAILNKVLEASGNPNWPSIIMVETRDSQHWALLYLIEEKSGNLAGKLRLLTEFNGVIDPITADVIVDAAFRGSPDDVRKAAQTIVRANTSNPLILNSALRLQPRMGATAENSQLVELLTLHAMPSPRDPSWRLEVRKALVARTLQLVAGESKLSVLDALSRLLAEAYTREAPEAGPRSADVDDPGASDAGAKKQAAAPAELEPLALARLLRVSLEQEADRVVPTGREPLSLAQMTVRRRQRAALASGVVQHFNVEQLACVELLAYITVAEDPTRAPRVKEILDELADTRQKAAHVIDQIAATERAALLIWLTRIGAVLPEEKVNQVEPTP